MKISRKITAVICAVALIGLTGCSDSAEIPADYDYDDLSEYITLGEYKGITYEAVSTEVTDEEVQDAVSEAVAATAETVQETSGTVTEDDTVNIDFVGSMDGVEFDGGTASGQTLDIDNSNYIDGFAEAIVGHDVGETFDIDVTFPDDYSNTDLAGKDAVFKITINYIEKEQTPEYNDEWVAANTDYTTTSEYEKSLRATLEEDKAAEAKSTDMQTVFDKIVEASEVIKYPEKEYHAKYDQLMDNAKTYAEASGMELSEYLESSLGVTEEEFEDFAVSSAQDAEKQEMVVYAIADAEGIETSDKDYNDYLLQLLKDNGFTEDTFESQNGMTIQEYAEDNNLYMSYLYNTVMEKVMEYSKAE